MKKDSNHNRKRTISSELSQELEELGTLIRDKCLRIQVQHHTRVSIISQFSESLFKLRDGSDASQGVIDIKVELDGLGKPMHPFPKEREGVVIALGFKDGERPMIYSRPEHYD